MSLRSSERGLKYDSFVSGNFLYTVAPFVGAWIEIISNDNDSVEYVVAPFVGAWIEMTLEDME